MVPAEDVIFSGFKFRRRFEWRRNLRFYVVSKVFCWKKTGKILTFRGLLKNGRKTCVHRGCFRKNSVNFYDFWKLSRSSKKTCADNQHIKGIKREIFPLFVYTYPPTTLRSASEIVFWKSAMCRADFHHCAVMELTCADESEHQFGFIYAILLCGATIQANDVIQLPLPPLCGGGICVFVWWQMW